MTVPEQPAAPVLVVGGTGFLGRQVVSALTARGRHVRALVRPGSDAAALTTAGVEVVRGDLLDPPSLAAALAGVDAVVASAAGYTRRRRTDTAETDTAGYRNLAVAAGAAPLRRFVLTGILRSDVAEDVPHFWHKTLAERALAEHRVPYVSLRPGAFFDQVMELLPLGGLRGGRLLSPGEPSVPQTWVLSGDVAAALAALVDAPASVGEHVDLGWDRPVSAQDIAAIASPLLGRQVRVLALPGPVREVALRLARRAGGQVQDLAAMLRFFASGASVADTTRQRELLGAVPTAEDAVRRWVDAGRPQPAPTASPSGSAPS